MGRRSSKFNTISEEVNTDIENVIYDENLLNRKFHNIKAANIKSKKHNTAKDTNAKAKK